MKEIKVSCFISGYYPELGNDFLVVMGGNEKMVEEFNRGEFGPYHHLAKENIQPGSFKLNYEEVTMY